jgi:DNA-binding MarR family transcriptional regulator
VESANVHADILRERVREVAGEVDTTGIELLVKLRMTANQYDALADERLRDFGLSGPRWGLLLRLMTEERTGTDGTTPTHLSRCQNVSKNTISALLGGLEEQGLVERSLDADDKRVFRIRLTESGRAIVQATAPEHVAFLRQLAAGLTESERSQLLALLGKLQGSLIEQSKLERA